MLAVDSEIVTADSDRDRDYRMGNQQQLQVDTAGQPVQQKDASPLGS